MKSLSIKKYLIFLSLLFASFIFTFFVNETVFGRQVVPGDFNLDDVCDSNDAVYLMMASMFSDSYPVYTNPDVNHDNVFNTDDSIYDLMHSLYPDEYPIDTPEPISDYYRVDIYPNVNMNELYVKETTKELQEGLRKLGYVEKDGSPLVVDGIYDNDMVEIVTLFQQLNGDSNPDGRAAAGKWTWGVLDNLLYELGRGNYTVPSGIIDWLNKYKKPAEEPKDPEIPQQKEEPKQEEPKQEEPEKPDIYNGRVSIYYGIPSNSYVVTTVKELQTALNKLGFTANNGDKLSEDGIYGEKTYEAVLKFQDSFDLGADGILGNRGVTWVKIDALLEQKTHDVDPSSYAAGSLSNCGKDENGSYRGGKAGDQTTAEYHVVRWYNYPWDCILRYEGERASEVRALIAKYATAAANNDHIGYDQNERLTFWYELEKCGYNPAYISSDCEADCSSSTAAVIRAVGYALGIDALKHIDICMTTRNATNVLTSAGFKLYDSNSFVDSSDYLNAGDVVLNVMNHVTICVSNGSKYSSVPSDTNVRVYIEFGSNNSTVRELQTALNILGYRDGNGNVLSVDGSYGMNTYNAVCKLQEEYDLGADGILSPNGGTWKTIDYMLANGIKAGERGKQPSTPSTSDDSFKVKVTTNSDNLNIRSGAGASYGVVGSAIRGNIYTVTKTATDGSGNTWYYLSELNGWGRSDYLSRQ